MKKDTDFNYYYVSVDPWNKISELKDLKDKYYVRGLPTAFILKNGAINQIYDGAPRDKTAYEWLLYTSWLSIKSGKSDRYFDVKSWSDHYFRNATRVSAIYYYAGLNGYKSFAIAPNKSHFVQHISHSNDSQAKADEEALEKCDETRAKLRVNTDCKLLFTGDNLVYPGLSESTRNVLREDFATASQYRQNAH